MIAEETHLISKAVLFVCIGNTCRSPMAVALAKRRWPSYRIESAGTQIASGGTGVAHEAVTVMAHFGLDISGHRVRSVADADIETYDCIVALDKHARQALLEQHSVADTSIKDMFVRDPCGDELDYERCAKEIMHGLKKLSI